MFLRLEAIALRLEANQIRLEAIALRLEAIRIRSEAITSRLEAIAFGFEDQNVFFLHEKHASEDLPPLTLRFPESTPEAAHTAQSRPSVRSMEKDTWRKGGGSFGGMYYRGPVRPKLQSLENWTLEASQLQFAWNQ